MFSAWKRASVYVERVSPVITNVLFTSRLSARMRRLQTESTTVMAASTKHNLYPNVQNTNGELDNPNDSNDSRNEAQVDLLVSVTFDVEIAPGGVKHGENMSSTWHSRSMAWGISSSRKDTTVFTNNTDERRICDSCSCFFAVVATIFNKIWMPI